MLKGVLARFFIKLESIDLRVSCHHLIAKTGWTVEELLEGIAKRNDLLPNYDLVTLLIGVNDQYRKYPLEKYKNRFPEALEKAIKFAGGEVKKVWVLSIPDYAFTPFGKSSKEISAEIDVYNAINAKYSKESGVNYIDITGISRLGILNPELVANDGLHPSGVQYELWSQQIFESILSIDPS